MSYDPSNQFRCTIIRGKAKKSLDNLLPAYANIINEICPCDEENFAREFNQKMSAILGKEDLKTLNNHRTEIAGKLFGMFFVHEDLVYSSERTNKYLDDSDQPAFFKDICFKFQFPNGMDKFDKLKSKILNSISIRPFSYILKLLTISEEQNIRLTKDEIGYYVLNSLEVLQGKVDPKTVFNTVKGDRLNNVSKKVKIPSGKKTSFAMQHINEQLNILELANLIRVDNKIIYLNRKERASIELISSFWSEKPLFDVYDFDLSSIECRKIFYVQWQKYYSRLNEERDFETSFDSLNISLDSLNENLISPGKGKKIGSANIELGTNGEDYVYEYEKRRVSNFNPRLSRKVKLVAGLRGLGYDIQSVIAEPGNNQEFAKYIEVKSTKRITVPDLEDVHWVDTVNLTRNEWIAAQQHKEFYSIYRVYFTPGNIVVYVINNPYEKNEEKNLNLTPVTYRLDFQNSAVDKELPVDKEEGLDNSQHI